MRSTLLTLFFLSALLISTSPAADRELLPVGAAVVDITPDYPVRLAGYASRESESEGIAARIHARAIAFGGSLNETKAGQPLAVLVTVDNVGVPAKVTEAVFQSLAEDWSLDRSQFVVSSTHTHSAPGLPYDVKLPPANLTNEQLGRMERYEVELTQHLTETARAAIAARWPARITLSFGEVTFARNRRVLKDGRYVENGVQEEGPVDHRVPVLAAHGSDGQLIAVLCNYACHATTNSGATNLIQGDWPGHAADFIEADHPGTVALIAVGCGADINPVRSSTEDYSAQHGRAFADEVGRLLSSDAKRTAIDPQLTCQLERITLPFGPLPDRSEWEVQSKDSGAAGERARRMLAKIDSGEGVPTELTDYPVQAWQFGNDLAMVFLAGEVVIDYSIRMNDMFDGDRLWINAYCNDVPCYIPSKRVLREGGYEADRSMVWNGLPGRLSPEVEDRICWAVQKQLPHEFYSDTLKEEFPAPKSPDEALDTMTTRRDLKIELVAAEPLIQDPVAFDWDTSGRLWVVEMGDYPAATDGGRVRVLSDDDGDGRYDSATTFLEGIPYPSGICVWRDGVIITAAPDLFYAEDTNGDGVSDKSTLLVTGFSEGNQQHRVNGLRWGLDGWLYLANGDSGGSVQSVGRTGRFPIGAPVPDPVSIRFRDIRIQPDAGTVEAISGQTQFGRERDDFGQWFGNNNSNPIWHYVIENRYVQRNPFAAIGRPLNEVSFAPGAAPVFPTSRTVARFNDFHTANRFTSACATAIYRDTALGQSFYGNAFTCEPVHNLVSRLVLRPDGVSFHGVRADDEQQSEFLSSSDNWFRPTMTRTGPDGAIYICDMYRQVIEHPQWIPADAQRKLDLRAGCDRGRIYRVIPRDHELPVPTWSLASWDEISINVAARWLSSRNGWWRDAAQRIIQHRLFEGADPWNNRLTDHLPWNHERPEVRIQALCTAGMAGRLSADRLRAALQDPDPRVRRRAIPLLEECELGENRLAVLQQLAGDADVGVRFQLACTLGSLSGGNTAGVLSDLLVSDHGEEWIRKAVFTSLNAENVASVFQAVARADVDNGSLVASLIEQCQRLGQSADIQQPIVDLLSRIDAAHTNAEEVTTAADVIRFVRRTDELSGSTTVSKAVRQAADMAWQLIDDGSVEPEIIAPAINLLAASNEISELRSDRLSDLVDPSQPITVQESALAALLSAGQVNRVIDRWSALSPARRQQALDAVVSRADAVRMLLDRVSDGSLPASEIGAIHRDQLLNHPDDDIRHRAMQLLGNVSSETRGDIVADWIDRTADLHGNATSGKAVFEKRCATCHRLNEVGQQVGASLDALRDRSKSALLTAILDPNRAVETKFLSYTVATTDGQTVSGMLQNETATSVTLLSTDGKPRELLRTEIDELVASSRSFMPEGLEKDMTPQEIADVVAFVQSAGSPWKQFDGNAPQVVSVNDDGTLELTASAAELYGPSLEFEREHGNIGQWLSAEDHLAWEVDVSGWGWWDVIFEYSCDDAFAGNQLKLATQNRMMTASVPGSGGWDVYREWHAGAIELSPGRRRISLSADQVNGALIDVRTIRLVPHTDR